MAATIAYATGFKRDGYQQASRASRLGHGSVMACANTWHTKTTAYVKADGSGYVEVVRDGKTIHTFPFSKEE